MIFYLMAIDEKLRDHNPILLRHFNQNLSVVLDLKSRNHQSFGFNLWWLWISVHNFMAMQSIVIEINNKKVVDQFMSMVNKNKWKLHNNSDLFSQECHLIPVPLSCLVSLNKPSSYFCQLEHLISKCPSCSPGYLTVSSACILILNPSLQKLCSF